MNRLTVLLTVAAGLAAFAFSPEAGEPPQLQHDESPKFKRYEGADVPFAFRVEELLDGLASMQKKDFEDGGTRAPSFLATAGLDPNSSAVAELLALNLDLQESHPRISSEVLNLAKAGEISSAEEPGGWFDERFAEAGRSFGAWLRSREAEGLAIGPLIDRLLNDGHMNLTLYSDEESFEETLVRRSLIFGEMLAGSFGRLPKSFKVDEESMSGRENQ